MAKTKLSQIPKFTPAFWFSLGSLISKTIRNRVQKRYKNYKDQKFVPYSNKFAGVGWRTLQIKGKNQPVFLDSYVNRKKAGKAAGKGISQASRSGIPDMTLTGKTMADLQVRRHTKDYVIYGWMGLQGGIVAFLEGMKNYQIIGKGIKILSNKEEKIIVDSIGKSYQKKIEKYHKGDITLSINIRF